MSRYNAEYVLISCHLIVILLTLLERSAYNPGRVLSSYRYFSKNHDELINFTGVVSKSVVFVTMQDLSNGYNALFVCF